MYGQGNYAPQYRPPPPFQPSQSTPLPGPPPPAYQQALAGAPPPPYQQGPPGPSPHPIYQHGAPPAQQPAPSYMPPPPQPYMHPPLSIHGNSPMPSSYAQPGAMYPPQLLPPPPRMLLPPLHQPTHLQSQSLYRTPHPPPPGIRHVPAPPPPAQSGFLSVTPATFIPLAPPSLAGDAFPPSLPPPPPPPLPPSSPPPLPPSPPPPASPVEPIADAPVVLGDGVIVGDENFEGRICGVKAGSLSDLPSPPPKPDDKEVVRNIEVLCDFIVKVGPHFEDLARTNEAGNPCFAFLFGGEPGSVAAIGHEYFQWMKKKCLPDMGSRKEQEQNGSMLSTFKGVVTSQLGNLEDKCAAVSPTASDMDMEDDVGQLDTDKEFGDLGNKLTEESSKMPFHAPMSTTEQLTPHIDISMPRTLSYVGSIAPLHDGEDNKDSQYIEDVSPVRDSPDTTECSTQKNVKGSPSGESSKAKVTQTLPGGKDEEVPKVYVNDGSPFRLIQDYASDDSEEDDQKQCAEHMDTTQSATCHSPVDLKSGVDGHDIFPQVDNRWSGKIRASEPSQNNDIVNADRHIGKQDSAKVDVDEFGRLIRQDLSDGDLDEIYSNERRVKRGRSRSRSPQESRWRRRSRSPRRKDKHSRSQSRSPQRDRSKSPSGSKRTNVFARQDWDHPPECFNFNRGRCFRGATCRFLHRDFTNVSRQQQFKDLPRDGGHDAASFSESNRTATIETDMEKCTDSPQKEANYTEMQLHGERTDSMHRSHNSKALAEKDPCGSIPEDAGTAVRVSQETIDEPLKVENVSEAPISSIEGSITQPPSGSPHTLPNETMRSQPSPPATTVPSQNVTDDSCREKSLSHASEMIQPSDILNQHPQTQSYTSFAPGIQAYKEESSVTHSDCSSGPLNQMTNQSSQPNEFPPQSFSGPDVNYQASQRVQPRRPLLHPHHSALPSTSYSSQPPHMSIFPSNRYPLPGEYHSHSSLPSNPGWSTTPPPPSLSHSNALPIRPFLTATDFPPQHSPQNSVPLRHDFDPIMRSYPPGETGRPLGGTLHQQPFHSVEVAHQPYFHTDEFRQRPLPMGSHHDHPGAPMLEGMSEMQRDYHLRNQSFLREEARIPLPGQVFATSSSLTQGDKGHLHSIPFPGDRLNSRPFSRDDFSTTARDLPYSHHPPPYGPLQSANSSFTLNSDSSGLVEISAGRYPSSFLDKPPPSFNTGLPRMPISSHYNPFTSTFDHPPTSLKFGSGIPGTENDTNRSRYDSSLISGHAPVGDLGQRLTASLPNSTRSGEPFLSKPGMYSEEQNTQKQAVREPVVGDPYDPLFDSIEPSSVASKKRDHAKEPKPVVIDAVTVTKSGSLRKGDGDDEQKGGTSAEHKAEVDEFGEAATDAEVGVVENASPHPVDDKDWSPPVPTDMLNEAAGEIEIDRIESPGKSKKSKESRSMRLFKIALADFVKEVLKPSWRQGNMSKEAFKTIVKKTVEKVSGAMSSHQIPKSQAKINQYVESSQRKLTKLVMGYVDKYVKA